MCNKLPNINAKEVLLVGTSPQLDFDLLKMYSENFSIGLHRVHKIYPLTSWRPSVLFLGDEALIIQQGKEIIAAQDAKTIIATGRCFWIPLSIWRNKISYLKLRQKSTGDFTNDGSSVWRDDETYIVGDSVFCLAIQYCIKERVRKIIITGVNFNYDQGYVDASISNNGINQPRPFEAKMQYVFFRKICAEIGIEVDHEF